MRPPHPPRGSFPLPRGRFPRDRTTVWTSLAIAGLLAGGFFLPGSAARPGTGNQSPVASAASVGYNTSLVYYTSSVDAFQLSYFETIPSPFNASHTYSLAVELHGLTGETLPVAGGTGGYVYSGTAQAAVNDGFILLDLNTRTGSGWYVDSKFTGPQEQDVLDAIAHERAHRHIGPVFLFGTSMGSIGTFTIGLDHPTLFRGLGVVAGFTDYFEMFDFLNSSAYASYLTSYMLLPTGGVYPNASAAARSVFVHLSSLRFHPENASGLRVYVANGAQDVLSSNNATLWPYQQANDTLLDATCRVSSTYAEPANCTRPLAALAALQPNRFHYRFVYEPNGPHSYALLTGSDLFDYWVGRLPGGTYWWTYPFPAPRAPPVPLVTLATRPWACGSLSIGSHTVTSGTTAGLAAGNYSVSVTGCANLSLASIHTLGQVFYFPRLHSLTVTGSGAVVVTFRSPSRRPRNPPTVAIWPVRAPRRHLGPE